MVLFKEHRLTEHAIMPTQHQTQRRLCRLAMDTLIDREKQCTESGFLCAGRCAQKASRRVNKWSRARRL